MNAFMRTLSRRESLLALSGLGVAATRWACGADRLGRAAVVVGDEARDIHASAPVFDGHNDLPWAVREKADGSLDRLDIAQPQPTLHTDIARLRAGGVGAQFWSAYVPAETGPRGTALQETLTQIEFIHGLVARYPDHFGFARTADEVDAVRSSGRIASLIGVEGGHSIQNSLAALEELHRLGVRYMTLTHSDTLDWADAASDRAQSDGLSPFGEEVVRTMNRLGMLVDLSHVSPETMRDALRVSSAPIIFSHSSTFAVAQHVRNAPDDVLAQLPQNGGVLMVNFFSGFIEPTAAKVVARLFDVARDARQKYPGEREFKAAMDRWKADNPMPRGSVHDVADHIEHAVKIAGVDHVGIGSDFDGVSSLPEQLDDVSSYPCLTQALLDRGYRREDIVKILGGNILRVMRQAEAVSQRA